MTEAPSPRDNEKTWKRLVEAIWREGWRAGFNEGWDQGFSNGRSALSSWRVVLTCIGFLAFGVAAGFWLDWVQTCQPIAASDVKSCITRFGSNPMETDQ